MEAEDPDTDALTSSVQRTELFVPSEHQDPRLHQKTVDHVSEQTRELFLDDNHKDTEDRSDDKMGDNKNDGLRGSQDDADADDDENTSPEMNLRQQMKLERYRYPGAEQWADEEVELFEILFLRQDIPILPHHWITDFLGAPMPENAFDTADSEETIIRALKEPQFPMTQALQQLIYLTGEVLASTQSGHLLKAPKLIEKRIKNFLSVVAQDAGYSHLTTVPNIFVETVDGLTGNYISKYMQNRMMTLAKLQIEFLRQDRPADFWDDIAPHLLNARAEKARFLNQLASVKKRSIAEAMDTPARSGPNFTFDSDSREDGRTKRRKIGNDDGQYVEMKDDTAVMPNLHARDPLSETDTSRQTENDEDWSTQTSCHGISPVESGIEEPLEDSLGLSFSRKPPVIYGLFILRSTVFLLTMDTAKGEGSHVTFHLDMDFLDSHQSVWNALTIAIAACRARDDMITRLDDFEPLDAGMDSDPDV